jgi:hypothetical protein
MRRRRLVAIACAIPTVAIIGCGGAGGKVSSASLQPRLLPSSQAPGLGLQRTLDWSDPVNLVGEGVGLPQAKHPSEGVKEFTDAHLKGAAGEILTAGSPRFGEETTATIGVAKLGSAGDAERVRNWMHSQDLEQPCYSQCTFSPYAASLPGVPGARYAIQSGKTPPPPPGAPRGVKVVGAAPANYFAEFTIGPYLYWASLHGDTTAKSRFEQGLRLYYAHARRYA